MVNSMNSVIIIIAMPLIADAAIYQIISHIDNGVIYGRTCSIEDGNRLVVNGRFIRYLTAQDRRELNYYQSKVAYWEANLNEHVQHRVNAGTNSYRIAMNRAFGPGGSYHRSFSGPFWESQHLNTPPPTTMPTVAPELTVEVPQIPFPDPPAFCLQ